MLPSYNRLPSVEIPLLLRAGTRIRGRHIDLVYQKHQMQSRFAVVVSAKVDKRAAKRNRMKRLIREAIQQILPLVKEHISGVFVVRSVLPDREDAVFPLVRDLLAEKQFIRGAYS